MSIEDFYIYKEDRNVKLHFLGANRQVTGSRYCLEAAGSKIMIDCGMFQERPYQSRNWDPSPIPPSECAAMLLTHVHIDHSGLIPRFVREGFRGPIYATRPSVELAGIMLRDSAKIQKEDAEYKKRRHKKEGRNGKHPEVPLYAEKDVIKTLKLFEGVSYGKPIQINDTFSVVFHDAGHILGSAMLEIEVRENGNVRRIIFSGDIGQWGKPLIRDPSLLDRADYVIMESTYGDRNHDQGGDIEDQLCQALNGTFAQGGNVVIPTFAVERSQELMYYLARLVHADRIPDVDVYLDSPMAVDVTEVFRNYRECFDGETWKLITSGEPPLRFPGLHMVRTADDSRAINEVKDPCVIMATSGMCTAGRIKHHLRRNISRKESTILFVGYQGIGTLGRQIIEGRKEVRIHGKMLPVKARIEQVYGFSGHADQAALLRWVTHFQEPPRHIFLTHGDEDAAQSLARLIEEKVKCPISIPQYQETVDLCSVD